MKVLSLFDGISAGRVALDRAGIKVDEYHAYEIDKYAIMVSEKNYPDIIHHGDVLDEDFTKYKGFDLLIMGPPCQDFSRAGGEAGFDGERGKLMLKAIEVLKTVKPKWWLIENTPMKKETVDTISELVGCKPVKIDAARVSAQRRERLYWTNIPIGLIEDRHILLEDIVEEDALVDKDKSHAIIASIGRTTHREYFKKNQGQIVWKAIELSNIYGGWGETKPRVHVEKSATIRTSAGGGHIPSLIVNNRPLDLENIKKCIRKVTPLECERLQTFPDRYTDVGISDTQRYKCLGNSWCVDVIAEIFKGMKE